MVGINKLEVAKLLTVMAAMYPKFEVTDVKVALWHDMIGDLPYELAQTALKKVMLTSHFPPTVAEVRKAAADIIQSGKEEMDAGKAWGEVQKAISKWGYYEPQKALDMLSPLTRQVAEQISWREICSCETPGVIRGQFMKMYDSLKIRKKENMMLPESFKNKIKVLASGGVKIGTESQIESPKG